MCKFHHRWWRPRLHHLVLESDKSGVKTSSGKGKFGEDGKKGGGDDSKSAAVGGGTVDDLEVGARFTKHTEGRVLLVRNYMGSHVLIVLIPADGNHKLRTYTTSFCFCHVRFRFLYLLLAVGLFSVVPRSRFLDTSFVLWRYRGLRETGAPETY